MQKILLIDGNNFMYAAQYSKNTLYAGDVETTAIFGVLGMIRNVMLRFPGSIPIVLWDSSPSWRVDIYPDYKGNRKLNPALVKITEALRPQRTLLKDLLNDMGIRQYSAYKYEADDLAADLSRRYSAKGGEVVLVTKDGDWQQLVNETVIWYDHKNDKIIDLQNFEAETGYKTPQHFARAKAIHGDTSDNIPGVGGLGEGSAKMILAEFDTLEDFVAAWPVFKASIPKGDPWKRYISFVDRAIVQDNFWEKYDLNTRLMDLVNRRYPSIEYRYEGQYNEDAVKAWFGRLGFHSLIRKYDEWLKPIEQGLKK
jgi:DNA polymerase-1